MASNWLAIILPAGQEPALEFSSITHLVRALPCPIVVLFHDCFTGTVAIIRLPQSK